MLAVALHEATQAARRSAVRRAPRQRAQSVSGVQLAH
jgi:hypothetical protein